jgi:Phage integrase, N-terminal SAM-like domain
VKADGTIHRARRSVLLGTVKHVTKLQAIEALRPYLDAVNLVAIPKAKAGGILRNFVEEWKRNVAPTLKPSTVRAAESHLRTHILPTMGDMSLAAINTRNVQVFISALTAKGLTRKSCDNVLQTLSGLLKTAKAWGYIPSVFDRSALSLPREWEKQEERHQWFSVRCVTVIRLSHCKSTRMSLETHSGEQWTLLQAAFWS